MVPGLICNLTRRPALNRLTRAGELEMLGQTDPTWKKNRITTFELAVLLQCQKKGPVRVERETHWLESTCRTQNLEKENAKGTN